MGFAGFSSNDVAQNSNLQGSEAQGIPTIDIRGRPMKGSHMQFNPMPYTHTPSCIES